MGVNDNHLALVVGGGPAGSAVAIWCAQLGLPVVLIERQGFPRDQPGETLHPGIEPLLKQLGVDERFLSAGFLRHQGNWIQWGSELRFEPFGSDTSGAWLGFQAWRASFDSILLDRARELGVEVYQPCRVLKPIVNGNRVEGVETSDGPFKSSFVIDAAGSRHWLARQLQLPIENYSPRLIARYGYAEGSCHVRDDAPAIVADEGGWTWTARVDAQLYQWTRLSFTAETSDRDWNPGEFHGLKPLGRTRGADVTWRAVTGAAGPGYFIVGDAAAVLDPASSHGVLRAIMSGIMAGHQVAQIILNGGFEDEAVDSYREWISSGLEKDVRKLRELYAMHPSPPRWI